MSAMASMNIHGVESIRLVSGDGTISGSPEIKWVDVDIRTTDGLEMRITCFRVFSNDPIRVIDETAEFPGEDPPADELHDIEEARGPVAALCAETAVRDTAKEGEI